jgi:dystrophin
MNEELAQRSTPEVGVQLRSEQKSLRSRYQLLVDTIAERILKLERMIADYKLFHDDFMRTVNWLNRIEASLQVENQALASKSSLDNQVNHLNQVKSDLDNAYANLNKLNEQAQRFLYAQNVDVKFSSKLKVDLNELNEKLAQLRASYSKKAYELEDALLKSNKVDNEINELSNWMQCKENEILDDEGIIITEEQFDQRVIKYKQIKSEIERKESHVKRVLDNGNEMLKSASASVANVNELARNLMSINQKWSNLNKKIDVKNKLFAQLSDYINELRHLLHEETSWLEKLEHKLNAAKIGADAEELSEQLDSIERLVKSRPHQAKERINDISTALIEHNILIQLANSDTKEFLFKWQRVHDEAHKKMQQLDQAINDVQNWEKRLIQLQEWMVYMDKYLSTRIEQDIFADDVPDDFARIQEEFGQNEQLLRDLEEGVEKYRAQGKLESATRLDQQLTVLRKSWSELSHKFKKFQKPADFDQKLSKLRKQLDDIEQAVYTIDVSSDDVDTIHLQLEHCMKFYKTLSELKSHIEHVLKQGRSIVEKKQVDNTDDLTKQLDTLKFKYNDLGARVTNGKNELEKAFKVCKKFRREHSIISDFLSKIDGELRKIEQKPLSKNYNDELEWIKNTKIEINKVETINLESIRLMRKSFDDLLKSTLKQQAANGNEQSNKGGAITASNKAVNSTMSVRMAELEERLNSIQKRIDDRALFLQEQARKLDESYEQFLSRSHHVLMQIEQLQHELIEAERHDARETYDRIEREVNTLLSDVEMIRAQGADLCAKSEQYCKVVETELRTVFTNFEDLNRRLNLAQERALGAAAQQAQGDVEPTMLTTTTTTTSKHTNRHESKYMRSRKTKSPSESSVDSTTDMFDSELRQKYMRAVAYLRILDEQPLVEHEYDQENYNENEDEYNSRYEQHAFSQHQHSSGRQSRLDTIDIDMVIEQAKNIARQNEKLNPERSRRILEKVSKLEQRWKATKSKRDSLKSSTKLYEQYKKREGNLNDQIHILEQHFSTYRVQESDERGENDWVRKVLFVFLIYLDLFRPEFLADIENHGKLESRFKLTNFSCLNGCFFYLSLSDFLFWECFPFFCRPAKSRNGL